jgi:phospholipase C
VLTALTSNPEVWSRTVFFLTFDENDGFFDHVPPPAVPSYNPDGTLAGKSTLDLSGEYFFDPNRKSLHPDDDASGVLRPWGLGPRVPMFVISPWSKGGWVNSQVFDHTSVGQFLEKRFGIAIAAISPWHRAVCGDLTSAFDFSQPSDAMAPHLPYVTGSSALVAENGKLESVGIPDRAAVMFQEQGTRPSRLLPYVLNVSSTIGPAGTLSLTFLNEGRQGAVFQVYDKLHLDRLPRRYTVEAGRKLSDEWKSEAADSAKYELWIYGPNGFLREFRADLSSHKFAASPPRMEVLYNAADREIHLLVSTDSLRGSDTSEFSIRSNAYRTDGPWLLSLARGERRTQAWSVKSTAGWYDFTVATSHFHQRFAGRLETGDPSTSDPALAA